MTKIIVSRVTMWVLSITLLWTAIFSFDMSQAVADSDPLYRFRRYERENASVTVWFRGPDSLRREDRRLKLRLPLKLARKQKLVDGIVSGNTCLLAALRGEDASVFEVALSRDLKRVRSIEEREPSKADTALFTGLMTGTESSSGAAKEDEAVVGIMGQQSCPPGQTLKIVGYKTVLEQRCQGANRPCIWVSIQQAIYGCVDTPTAPQPPQLPNPQPPQQPNPPSSPSGCSASYSCRYSDGSLHSGTVMCEPRELRKQGSWGTLVCNPCQYTPAPGCSNTTQPPTPPSLNCTDRNQKRCTKGSDTWCCAPDEFCGSAVGSCDISPPPPVLCGPNEKTCQLPNETWCCPTNQSCGSNVGACNNPPPPPPSGPCPGNYAASKTKQCGNRSTWTCCEPTQSCSWVRATDGTTVATCSDGGVKPPTNPGSPSNPQVPVVPAEPPTSGGCYQDLKGNWTCPNAGTPARPRLPWRFK
jgi:hypothetical protein